MTVLRARRRLPAPAVNRAIRRAAGCTQCEVAAALNVNRVTVARWESGERVPRGELRDRYAELLDGLQQEAAR
jgi:transcriptional regulator with XRE-family HTH domain